MHYFLGAKKAHFTFGIHNSKETLTAKVINSVKILQFKIITSNPFVLCISLFRAVTKGHGLGISPGHYEYVLHLSSWETKPKENEKNFLVVQFLAY